MEPRDREQDEKRWGPDHLDRWLDSALHEYGTAEPRMGLEGRVLATLAAEKVSLAVRRRWLWASGSVAAMAALGAVLWLGGMNHGKSVGSVARNATSAGQKTGPVKGQSEVKQPVMGASVQPRTRPRPAKTAVVAAEPRRSQFPSSRPLSEQEQMLVRYVTESPSEAVLVAKEQAERQKELEKLTGDESSKNDSDQ